MPADERLVVTEARPVERVVVEINGLPAAEEYARILGLDVGDLDPVHFAASPVVVLIDGANYVRSIQKADPDGSLKFYCAIERGVVLRVARSEDLVANLESAFSQVRAQIGPPQLVLTFDCISASWRSPRAGSKAVSDILGATTPMGFNTYGEQFCGVHVNQTLTAVALGSGAGRLGRPGMPDREHPDGAPRTRALQAEIARLNKVVDALMDRSEASMNVQGSDFGLFQTTVMLQDQVRLHTEALETALRDQRPASSDPAVAAAAGHADAAPNGGAADPAARARRPAEGRRRAHRAGRRDPGHAHRALRHPRPRRGVLADRGRLSRPRTATLEGLRGRARGARPAVSVTDAGERVLFVTSS